MIYTLAIDPGLKPGCVVLDTDGLVVRASHKLDEDLISDEWEIVATEGQWLHGRDVDAHAIITLAFRAGFTLASIPAERRMRIPPKVWRGSTNASKQVVQNRILRTLSPAERALFSAIPKGRHGDVLDAIGIGRAAQRLAEEGNDSYDYTL